LANPHPKDPQRTTNPFQLQANPETHNEQQTHFNFNNEVNTQRETESLNAPDQSHDCGSDLLRHGGSSTSGSLAFLSSSSECIFFIFGFGFLIRLVFVLDFVLGFLGLWKFEKGEREKKRSRGRWGKNDFCFLC